MLALETRFLPVMLGILIQTENAIQSNYWRHHKTVKVIKLKLFTARKKTGSDYLSVKLNEI